MTEKRRIGLCEECGDEIPEARRRALPGARTCVACQSSRDRSVAFGTINRRGHGKSPRINYITWNDILTTWASPYLPCLIGSGSGFVIFLLSQSTKLSTPYRTGTE